MHGKQARHSLGGVLNENLRYIYKIESGLCVHITHKFLITQGEAEA